MHLGFKYKPGMVSSFWLSETKILQTFHIFPRLNFEAHYLHKLLKWSSRPEACKQHCETIQTFKSLWGGKTKISSGNTKHLRHFSNFQLLCAAQAEDLHHFRTAHLSPLIPHPHCHFQSTVIFPTEVCLKYVKCFNNFKLSSTVWAQISSLQHLRANKIWSASRFSLKNMYVISIVL